ncbi:hypothetical protein F2Q69_00012359 [Brassica cretica]|uniref:Tr-type G domain-containing protein n=1 Tax=Brassica cretica TaxID=69181 RepID=A0A8S9R070_BRACR|nr:hypothetical protein F2Q69_00012359 [Brassica cretica]
MEIDSVETKNPAFDRRGRLQMQRGKVKKKTLVRRNDVRNIAIVAHVDHSKTTLVVLCLGKLRQGAKLVLKIGHCKDCERYQYKSFELNIVVSQACLAGVSLLCVSHNLRKHGIRKFFFVDQLSGRMGRLKAQYIQQISNSVIVHGLSESWNLLYKPQVPHLSASTVSGVTVSQFTTLFQITAYSGRITYINSGDFAVSAVVQVVGIILCLHAATKISHRAQAIASVASKWHAIMSCSSTDTTQIRTSPSGVHLEATTNPPISFQN